MEIITYPNDVLRQVSTEVSLPVPEEDKSLLNELFAYVKEHSDTAAGLSAIQVGIPKRMCAIRFSRNGKTTAYKLVNPKIIAHSIKKIYNKEGCLSVDTECDAVIGRWESIKVSAFDLIQNKQIIINAYGFESIVLQHEIDHMDGKLFIDYLNQTW